MDEPNLNVDSTWYKNVFFFGCEFWIKIGTFLLDFPNFLEIQSTLTFLFGRVVRPDFQGFLYGSNSFIFEVFCDRVHRRRGTLPPTRFYEISKIEQKITLSFLNYPSKYPIILIILSNQMKLELIQIIKKLF